jgi:LPPG:FO 2-phospho-L-lactate transferase
VSIDPILTTLIPPLSQWGRGKAVIAISPIIGGQTVKGPAAKMYRELGIEPSAFAVANHYRGLATGFVLDRIDAQLIESVRGLNMQTLVTNTLMNSHEDRRRLAHEVLDFIGSRS